MKDCYICEENIINEENINAVRNKMIEDDNVIKLSNIYKALGDPTRIKILYALTLKELCVCDNADIIGMSQSAVSHQLRILRNLRLVKYKKEGKIVFYSLNDQHVIDLFNQGLEHIKHD